MRQVTNGTALRVVKNEKVICTNCLSSGAGPSPETVYCFLNHTEAVVKGKDMFCPHGTWLVNGKVMDFKEAFQAVYDKDKTGEEKEINV